MRKPWIASLLAVTLLFVGFTLGFFLGRNTVHGPVVLSSPQNAPAETVQTETQTPIPDPTAPSGDTASTLPTPPSVPEKINVNTADLAQLTTLPGIGPVLAQRILDYREENGPFASLDALTNVEGIGTKRLEGILEYATVGGTE